MAGGSHGVFGELFERAGRLGSAGRLLLLLLLATIRATEYKWSTNVNKADVVIEMKLSRLPTLVHDGRMAETLLVPPFLE